MRPQVDVLYCGDPECGPYSLDDLDEEILESGFLVPTLLKKQNYKYFTEKKMN